MNIAPTTKSPVPQTAPVKTSAAPGTLGLGLLVALVVGCRPRQRHLRLGNVGYMVAAFGALGYFYPAFGDGNTPAAIVGASVVLWVIHALLLRGIQGPRCSMPW